MKALFVEDEKLLADALKHLFENNGIEADIAYEGSTGNILALSGNYDILILDIMIPGDYDGLGILKNVRDNNINIPILMLTAKDSLQDKVKGLNLGADDYLVKPFESDELLARVNALTRRFEIRNEPEQKRIKLLRETSEILVDNNHIPLTQKEMQLLECLMKAEGKPLSKSDILNQVWGEESGITDSSVELYIHYLRKKLDNTRINIKTVRNQGYFLSTD